MFAFWGTGSLPGVIWTAFSRGERGYKLSDYHTTELFSLHLCSLLVEKALAGEENGFIEAGSFSISELSGASVDGKL